MKLMCISLNDVNFAPPEGSRDVRLDGKAANLLLGGPIDGTSSAPRGVVGRGGLEPPTSRLSGVRSNHLSYRPIWWSVSGSNR